MTGKKTLEAISLFPKEKNATSAPEINAEPTNKSNKAIKLITVILFTELIAKNKISGSGSKSNTLNYLKW